MIIDKQVTTSTSSSTSTSSGISTTTTTSPSTNPSTTTTTTTKPGTPGPGYPDSLCLKVGYCRDPYDCSLFYYCQLKNESYEATKYNCPAGLAYNEVIVACDWKENVPNCN